MENSFYYYLDTNVFAGIQFSKSHYDKFFKDLPAIDKFLKIEKEDRKFISTPFAIIEYLGIEKEKRLKPNQQEIGKHFMKCKPQETFLDFCKYALTFFDNNGESYYEFLVLQNEKKFNALPPHMKYLWNELISKAIVKEDFKEKLIEAIRWDYITDWFDQIPSYNKINVSSITSELLHYAMNNDSFNMLRLVKRFNSIVDMKKFTSQHIALNEQILQIEKRRQSLLKRKAIKTAGRDLIDSDLNQLSVTGFKENKQDKIPVIFFTTDDVDKIFDRIYLLKQIIGILYNKTENLSHKAIIDNYKPGIIVRLSKFTRKSPFNIEEVIETKTINVNWLNTL